LGILSKLHHLVRTTPWLGRLALRTLPDLRWKVYVKPIGKLEIRLRRDRNCWLRSPVASDGFMLGSLQRLIRPGDVVYDLGSNIGLYSRFILQEFKASKVYAFEPMSGNYPRVIRNLEIGGCASQSEVLRYAIGDEDGFVDFQMDELSSVTGALDSVTHGAASVNRRQYHLPPTKEVVQIARLDTLIGDGVLLPADVIKIDIEGAEAMALRGSRKLLSERRPRLVVELHSGAVGAEVLQILWEYNYHCFGYLPTAARPIYKQLAESDLPEIIDKYWLKYIAASVREEELALPIESPQWCMTIS